MDARHGWEGSRIYLLVMKFLLTITAILIAAALLSGCAPSEAVARYCVEQGHVEGSAAFQECVEERHSYRRLRYLKGGAGAGR